MSGNGEDPRMRAQIKNVVEFGSSSSSSSSSPSKRKPMRAPRYNNDVNRDVNKNPAPRDESSSSDSIRYSTTTTFRFTAGSNHNSQNSDDEPRSAIVVNNNNARNNDDDDDRHEKEKVRKDVVDSHPIDDQSLDFSLSDLESECVDDDNQNATAECVVEEETSSSDEGETANRPATVIRNDVDTTQPFDSPVATARREPAGSGPMGKWTALPSKREVAGFKSTPPSSASTTRSSTPSLSAQRQKSRQPLTPVPFGSPAKSSGGGSSSAKSSTTTHSDGSRVTMIPVGGADGGVGGSGAKIPSSNIDDFIGTPSSDEEKLNARNTASGTETSDDAAQGVVNADTDRDEDDYSDDFDASEGEEDDVRRSKTVSERSLMTRSSRNRLRAVQPIASSDDDDGEDGDDDGVVEIEMPDSESERSSTDRPTRNDFDTKIEIKLEADSANLMTRDRSVSLRRALFSSGDKSPSIQSGIGDQSIPDEMALLSSRASDRPSNSVDNTRSSSPTRGNRGAVESSSKENINQNRTTLSVPALSGGYVKSARSEGASSKSPNVGSPRSFDDQLAPPPLPKRSPKILASRHHENCDESDNSKCDRPKERVKDDYSKSESLSSGFDDLRLMDSDGKDALPRHPVGLDIPPLSLGSMSSFASDISSPSSRSASAREDGATNSRSDKERGRESSSYGESSFVQEISTSKSVDRSLLRSASNASDKSKSRSSRQQNSGKSAGLVEDSTTGQCEPSSKSARDKNDRDSAGLISDHSPKASRATISGRRENITHQSRNFYSAESSQLPFNKAFPQIDARYISELDNFPEEGAVAERSERGRWEEPPIGVGMAALSSPTIDGKNEKKETERVSLTRQYHERQAAIVAEALKMIRESDVGAGSSSDLPSNSSSPDKGRRRSNDPSHNDSSKSKDDPPLEDVPPPLPAKMSRTTTREDDNDDNTISDLPSIQSEASLSQDASSPYVAGNKDGKDLCCNNSDPRRVSENRVVAIEVVEEEIASGIYVDETAASSRRSLTQTIASGKNSETTSSRSALLDAQPHKRSETFVVDFSESRKSFASGDSVDRTGTNKQNFKARPAIESRKNTFVIPPPRSSDSLPTISGVKNTGVIKPVIKPKTRSPDQSRARAQTMPLEEKPSADRVKRQSVPDSNAHAPQDKDMYVATLQAEYSALLAEHAQAKNLIDKIKITSKIDQQYLTPPLGRTPSIERSFSMPGHRASSNQDNSPTIFELLSKGSAQKLDADDAEPLTSVGTDSHRDAITKVAAISQWVEDLPTEPPSSISEAGTITAHDHFRHSGTPVLRESYPSAGQPEIHRTRAFNARSLSMPHGDPSVPHLPPKKHAGKNRRPHHLAHYKASFKSAFQDHVREINEKMKSFYILTDVNQMNSNDMSTAFQNIQSEFDRLLHDFKDNKSEYVRQFRRSKSMGVDVAEVHQELDADNFFDTELHKIEKELDAIHQIVKEAQTVRGTPHSHVQRRIRSSTPFSSGGETYDDPELDGNTFYDQNMEPREISEDEGVNIIMDRDFQMKHSVSTPALETIEGGKSRLKHRAINGRAGNGNESGRVNQNLSKRYSDSSPKISPKSKLWTEDEETVKNDMRRKTLEAVTLRAQISRPISPRHDANATQNSSFASTREFLADYSDSKMKTTSPKSRGKLSGDASFGESVPPTYNLASNLDNHSTMTAKSPGRAASRPSSRSSLTPDQNRFSPRIDPAYLSMIPEKANSSGSRSNLSPFSPSAISPVKLSISPTNAGIAPIPPASDVFPEDEDRNFIQGIRNKQLANLSRPNQLEIDRDSGFIGSEGSRQSRPSTKNPRLNRGIESILSREAIAEANDAVTLLNKYGRDSAALNRNVFNYEFSPEVAEKEWGDITGSLGSGSAAPRGDSDVRDEMSCAGSSGHSSGERGHNNAEILMSLQREVRQLKEALQEQQREFMSRSSSNLGNSRARRWESPQPTMKTKSPRASSGHRRRRTKSTQNVREIGSEAETSTFSSSETSISTRGYGRGDGRSRGSRTPSRGRDSRGSSRQTRPTSTPGVRSPRSSSDWQRQSSGGRRATTDGNVNPSISTSRPYLNVPGNVDSGHARYLGPDWVESEARFDNHNRNAYLPPHNYHNPYSTPTPIRSCTCPSCSNNLNYNNNNDNTEYDYSSYHHHNNPHTVPDQGILPPSHFHPIHNQQQRQYSTDGGRNFRNSQSYLAAPPIVEPKPVMPGYFSPPPFVDSLSGMLSPTVPADGSFPGFSFIASVPPPNMNPIQQQRISMYDRLPPPSQREMPIGAPDSAPPPAPLVTINTGPGATSTPTSKSTVGGNSTTRYYRRDDEPSSPLSSRSNSASLRRLRRRAQNTPPEQQQRKALSRSTLVGETLNYNNNGNGDRPSAFHHATPRGKRASIDSRRELFVDRGSDLDDVPNNYDSYHSRRDSDFYSSRPELSTMSLARYSSRDLALTRAVEAADHLKWSSRRLLSDVQRNFSQSLIDLDLF